MRYADSSRVALVRRSHARSGDKAERCMDDSRTAPRVPSGYVISSTLRSGIQLHEHAHGFGRLSGRRVRGDSRALRAVRASLVPSLQLHLNLPFGSAHSLINPRRFSAMRTGYSITELLLAQLHAEKQCRLT